MRSAPVLLAAFFLTTVAVADEPAALQRLFPQQAEVHVERAGLSRLLLPPEVLAACSADLSDLRLFDDRDREVAFVVDRGPVDVEVTERFSPPVLDVRRSETGRRHAPTLRREQIEIGLPEQPPRSGSWTLILTTGRRDFVARVRVEAVAADGSSQLLIEEDSLFRLPGATAEKVDLALPPVDARRLRVIFATEGSGWLDPSLRLESARRFDRSARIAVPLEVASIDHTGDRTVVGLLRPRGIVPDLLRAETATGTFDRTLEVWDEGSGSANEPLGKARLFRVEALVPVERAEMSLRPARGERLRVVIEDGDSPPLEEPVFSAVIRQPALVFSLPSAAGATLRFGGGRAHLPRYDLAGLLPDRRATGQRAEAAAALYDVGTARLGRIAPNPAYDGAPALAFAMRAGAPVERGLFRQVRSLSVPDSAEGLSRLTLDESDLAILSDDLSDLRVADDSSRQWPYLVEPEAVERLVPVEVRGPERHESESRYRLESPVESIRPNRIVLQTDTPYFDREYRLMAEELDGEQVTLAKGRISRPIDDPRPVAIDLPFRRVESMELIVEDGDDASLVFGSVQARILLPDLYLTAPAGNYALLLGAPDLEPARYDLERVRNVVLAVRAEPVQAGNVQANPDFSLQARLTGSGTRQRVILWSVLVAAVLILGTLTLRLARS